MSESLLLAERVADDIERLIAEGYYSPGEKLPSEAILTEKYKIGRSTLREATKILKTKNVLESHRGIGTFVRTPSSNETVFSLAHQVQPFLAFLGDFNAFHEYAVGSLAAAPDASAQLM